MTDPVKVFEKQPGDGRDFDISFKNWLANRGDTIASFTTEIRQLVVTGAEPIVANPLVFSEPPLLVGNGDVVRLPVAGGTDLQDYVVTIRLVTVGPPVRRPEVDVIFKVREAPRRARVPV
jgi:hypothetical protein